MVQNYHFAFLRNFLDLKNSAHVPNKVHFYLIDFLFLFQAAGKYRQQGRNYTVDDGDIIFVKFNAGAGLTAAKKK